jgi:hypothetical protein
MPAAINPATLDAIRAGADTISGVHRLLMTIARRLEGEPAREESDEPAGPAGATTEMLCSELRCILEDGLAPAAQALQNLAADYEGPSGGKP